MTCSSNSLFSVFLSFMFIMTSLGDSNYNINEYVNVAEQRAAISNIQPKRKMRAGMVLFKCQYLPVVEYQNGAL